MDQMLELFLICFWGIVLGFIYKIFAGFVRRKPKVSYVFWTFCGAIFFIATALFLFYLNQGNVGLYGFPVMALGFFLALHFLYEKTARVSRPFRSKTRGFFYFGNKIICFIAKGILLPFSLLARGGEWLLLCVKKILLKIFPKKEIVEEHE